ncbi:MULTISPECIES: DNA endonuclease SmrA [Pseudoalteromonas]|uniref:DNA endonuclease SmrA n=1 Tax=Pseudoalteromonas TaxID=53246 RepID=UPI0026E3C585|nr:DNA endonuclease SmrA [Pseudoalteromonas carrageenovora]MDO6464577.1 DNA endonuclease SmrA [Pseudoalteromonas carrageenovora]MDO6636598.1 DNA endonuclease SmrA [Pseudoalteromonas carrageenovora]MDO6648960.1 DNA endonuclease SmrA [Pseudoalteromonas carrageenovora]
MPLSDFDLFLSSMEDVKPINHDTVTPISNSHSATLAQQEKRKAAQINLANDENYLQSEHVEILDPLAILSFKKDGVQSAVFKNLRLAKYQVDATLDLHGQLLKNARNTLFSFIADCHQRNIRVVLIRHGIGIKNKAKPGILKSYVNKWLQELPQVLAFHTALRHHGGSGATYVLLKKSEEKKHENREIHSKRG